MTIKNNKRNGLISNDVVVMNFSGVYDMEKLPHNSHYKWLDCRHLSGTDCYCDEEGKNALIKIIEKYPVEGVHFIDSGNYHYVTKLWTDRIKEPFVLVVFDHHPDMQPSLFEHILSCGSWVKDILDSNTNCKKVVLVGAAEQLIQTVSPEYKDRVHFYSDHDLDKEENWKRFSKEFASIPVYISIDKDVLSPDYAVTNWDQGSMNLKELEKLLHIILNNHSILGIDVCGEFLPDTNMTIDIKDADIDGYTNKTILHLINSEINNTAQKRSHTNHTNQYRNHLETLPY